MARVVPPERYDTFDAWRDATQQHQAVVVRRVIETMRRLKFRPTGGFCVYRYRDTTPQIGFGLCDASGTPKRAWSALIDACRPVIIVADPLPAALNPGDHVRLGVHVVSDERAPRDGAVVRARLSGPLGTRSWEWTGDIAADACTRIGEIDWIAPSVGGPVTLDIELVGDNLAATNRYQGVIEPRGRTLDSPSLR